MFGVSFIVSLVCILVITWTNSNYTEDIFLKILVTSLVTLFTSWSLIFINDKIEK